MISSLKKIISISALLGLCACGTPGGAYKTQYDVVNVFITTQLSGFFHFS